MLASLFKSRQWLCTNGDIKWILLMLCSTAAFYIIVAIDWVNNIVTETSTIAVIKKYDEYIQHENMLLKKRENKQINRTNSKKRQTEEELSYQVTSDLYQHQSRAYHRLNYTVIYKPVVKQDIDLILFIYSTCTHNASLTRDVIRQTWANRRILRRFNISMIFVLGERELLSSATKKDRQALEVEMIRRNDILLFSFIDSFQNLTLKTLNAMKWFINSTDANFMIKCHSDTMLNIGNIHNIIQNLTSNNTDSDFIIGHQQKRSLPNRNIYSKRFVPKKIYNHQYYPSYIEGAAFVISRAAAVKLTAVSNHIDYLYLEDVFITGLCRKEANISVIHIEKFIITNANNLSVIWGECMSVRSYHRSIVSSQWIKLGDIH